MKKSKIKLIIEVITNKKIIYSIGIGLVIIISAFFMLPVMKPREETLIANASFNSPSVDGIECGPMEMLGFHIHVDLNIFINGSRYLVPPLVGITNECFYWLHTHDNSGIIHIESPVKRNFTLGQFFDIWDNKSNDTHISNTLRYGTSQLNVYVNGSKVANGTNYRNAILHAHDVISMVLGKSPTSVPFKYNFPRGL